MLIAAVICLKKIVIFDYYYRPEVQYRDLKSMICVRKSFGVVLSFAADLFQLSFSSESFCAFCETQLETSRCTRAADVLQAQRPNIRLTD